jgi:heat shock protein HtpX
MTQPPAPASPAERLSLLDWKASNLRASWLLALALVALLALLGYGFGVLLDPALAGTFMLLAALFGGGQAFVAYWFSDRMALAATAARPANEREHRYLLNITEAVALGAGVPMPKLYVIDDPSPNAFATGRDPAHGTVAVTTGLLALLDRQELEGVIAHELAHIKNFDIRLASMLMATVGAIVLLRDVAMRSLLWGGSRRSSRSSGGGQAQLVGMVLVVVLVVLAPLLALLLRMAVSRRREFLADATAAYLTRNPDGLMRALIKLQDPKQPSMKVNEAVAHMFFTNPLRKRNASNLFATHPPLEERIDRLRRM